MKVIKIGSLCLIVLLFFASECFAFRCGSSIISTGDTKAQVSITCGNPTAKETTCNKIHRKCAHTVEIWHYNCGDNDYIYALTFEDGVLINETTVGRGKGSSNCRGK